ncbi:LysR family transcriptional regulator, partial [Herbaspirillum sp. HC18]
APDDNLVGRVFLHDRLVVVARPDQLRSGDGPVPAVVRGEMKQGETWQVATSSGQSSILIDPMLSLSSLVMVRDAVRMGVGMARLPVSLVSHDLAAGTLVHWGDVEGPDIALWALYPTRRLLSARVSAFLDYLREAFPRGTPDELAAYVGK